MSDKKMYNDKYNPPDNYRDLDGNMKTFTYIDYSKKQKKSMYIEEGNPKELLRLAKIDMQDDILKLPASLFPKEFEEFIIRDVPNQLIKWNEIMIRDEGTPFNTLRNLKVLTENRLEIYGPQK